MREERFDLEGLHSEHPTLSDIYQESPIAIEIYDSQGRLADLNPACQALFGISDVEEVKKFDLFKDPNLPSQLIADIKNGQSAKYEFDFNFNLVKRNNLYKTTRNGICSLECYICPAKNSDNKISGYILYITEITERKNAEKELAKSEEKFRRIVENSTRGMYFYELKQNDQLILIGSNPAADQIGGISHQSFIGKPIEEVFPNLMETNFPELYKKIARGESGPTEFDIAYKDSKISGYFNVHVFQTERNRITVNFSDITERKNTELLLAEQARELREINAMKDKFMSIIAHDLKSPFNAILGFSELLLKNFKELDGESILQGLTTIESASNHAYKLLENLLIWARNQSGKIDFTPEKLNMKEHVYETLEMLEGFAQKKNIKFVVSIPKKLNIVADKNMTDTILRNLISNAIKFSKKGSSVKIVARSTDNEVEISVIDRGIGIKPERLSSVFDIDRQKNTLGTENEQGTGLGLILCKEFVIRHDGKIWVESELGKGSIFTFSLPFGKKNDS